MPAEGNMEFKEKKHRLPMDSYKGDVSVVFTLCLRKKKEHLNQTEIVATFTGILNSILKETSCIVPVYCFMADHQHLIVTGTCRDSDTWMTIVKYKQKTGFWMLKNRPEMRWQKDFYDHIMRTHEDIVAQVKYILDNPVRKELVSSWQNYPFKGSIGCKLGDVLLGII
jgi:putative transposase